MLLDSPLTSRRAAFEKLHHAIDKGGAAELEEAIAAARAAEAGPSAKDPQRPGVRRGFRSRGCRAASVGPTARAAKQRAVHGTEG